MIIKNIATIYAVIAATLYAINVPLSKLFLNHSKPIMMAAFLYLGAGIGFVAYGLSIHFYIMAQKDLGAAKTSAYYSIAPFMGVLFSVILLGEKPKIQFYAALIIMIISTYVMVKDTIQIQHTHKHEHIHTHEHSLGEVVHTHEHKHIHSHIHAHDGDMDNHTHKHKFMNHQHSH